MTFKEYKKTLPQGQYPSAKDLWAASEKNTHAVYEEQVNQLRQMDCGLVIFENESNYFQAMALNLSVEPPEVKFTTDECETIQEVLAELKTKRSEG
jgi:hypothetical protein